VIGGAGTYAVDSDDGQTDHLLAGRTPATEGDAWGSVPEARWGRIYRAGVGEPVPTERGSWSSFYAGFASAVRGQAAVPVNPWDAVRALGVLDAARTSATQGRVVELST
jgi:predicted dehydrogenase